MIENRPKWQDIMNPSSNGLNKGIFSIMSETSELIQGTKPEYLDIDKGKLILLDISSTSAGYDRALGAIYDILPQNTETQTLLIYCAGTAYQMFNNAWSYQYKALTAEYNPIHNYDSVENSTDTHEYTGTQSTEHEVTKNNTDTPDITRTSNGSNDSAGSLYGFNSTTAVPSDEANGKSQSTDKETGTVTSNGTENGTNTRTDNLKETITHELTRSGNIGVTTSQQMIESELELRKKQFYNIMIRDIINFLCLPIY